MREVARQAGVSRTTVSMVLNNSPVLSDKTRAKVLRIVKRLHYVPDPVFQRAFRRRGTAGRLVSSTVNPTRTIGFYTSEKIYRQACHDDGYYHLVFSGIQRAIAAHKYFLTIQGLKTDDLQLPDIVSENRVEGLIVEGTFPRLVLDLIAQRMPLVLIDRIYDGLAADSVLPNVEQAVREQLDYLAGLGHHDVVIFQPDVKSWQVVHYLRAFREYCAGKDMAMAQTELCRPRDISPESHGTVMKEYARSLAEASPRPTAIMTFDVYACSLIEELQGLGLRVPQDISVLGMDDVEQARATVPQLTSYRFPMEELGSSAVDLLISRIQNPKQALRQVFVNGKLVERGSALLRRP